MHYALTINEDKIITGIYSSQEAFTSAFFDMHPELHGQTLKPVSSPSEYVIGMSILAFEDDGRLRFHIDLIKEGLTPCPQGYCIEGNELIRTKPNSNNPYRGETERIRDECLHLKALAIANSEYIIERELESALSELGV